jgi:hypothetical protein
MAFYMKMGSKSLKASSINMNGSPLPKVNCPDGTPPPCSKPSQASVDSKAQTKADQATKVYSGGSRSVVNNPNGTTTYNRTRNFTQDGEANESRPDNLPSYDSVGVSKEEGEAYWASKRNSGSESDSFTTVNLEPMPMQMPTMLPTAGPIPDLPTKEITYTPVDAPPKELRTSDGGMSTTNKYKPGKQKKKGRSLFQAKLEDFFSGDGPCGGPNC